MHKYHMIVNEPEPLRKEPSLFKHICSQDRQQNLLVLVVVV